MLLLLLVAARVLRAWLACAAGGEVQSKERCHRRWCMRLLSMASMPSVAVHACAPADVLSCCHPPAAIHLLPLCLQSLCMREPLLLPSTCCRCRRCSRCACAGPCCWPQASTAPTSATAWPMWTWWSSSNGRQEARRPSTTCCWRQSSRRAGQQVGQQRLFVCNGMLYALSCGTRYHHVRVVPRAAQPQTLEVSGWALWCLQA